MSKAIGLLALVVLAAIACWFFGHALWDVLLAMHGRR